MAGLMAAEITTVCVRAVQAGRDEVKQQAELAGKTHLLNKLEATRYDCVFCLSSCCATTTSFLLVIFKWHCTENVSRCSPGHVAMMPSSNAYMQQ